jgi:quercetin dioxygenase-like cupin family protein
MKNVPVFTLAAAVAFAFAPFGASLAAEPPPADVVVIEHGKVDNAFAQGRPLLINSSYKIQAGRRVTAPGEVEVHEHDTDIFYVTEGTATLVTGGETEGGKTTAAGEIRGKKIAGGTQRMLQKGDIVVVPAGVPHWFTEVSNPFLYLVIKVTK